MMRVLFSGVCFLLVWMIETSFLSSLPSLFSIIPLVFALSVYLIQYHGLIDGLVWIVCYGLFLQLFHFTTVPLPIVSFAVAGLISYISAKQLFSNRSFYGVAACATAGFLSRSFLETLFAFFFSLQDHRVVDWNWFFQIRLSEFVMLFFTIFLLFILLHPLRKFLRYSIY